MGILESLLGGGGSDPYELYGDLLTDKQKAALRDQQQGQGLLRMAAALGQAAMPSRLPVPIGAVLGQAAGALSGNQDEALKGIMTAAQIRELQAKEKFREQVFGPDANARMEALVRASIGGGGMPAAAPAAAPPAGTYLPGTAPLAPGSSDAPPRAGPNAPPPAAAPGPFDLGGLGVSPAPGGTGALPLDLGGTPSGAPIPLDAPAAPGKASSLGPMQGPLAAPAAGGPDQLVGQGSQLQGLLSAAYGGGGANGTPPFSLASLDGSGGGSPGTDEPTPDEARKLGLIRQYESGNRNIMQGVVGPQGGYNPSVGRVTGPSSAGGYYQMIDPTWRGAASKAGIDTQQYPRAIDAPEPLQTKAALALLREQGTSPWAPYNAPLARALGGQDTVIPSGRGVPASMLRNVADTGGGAAGGVPGMPPVPVPPGVNPQAMNALLLELARRNAAAEVLGMGNPYGSMLQVLQGTPQYKAQIETATRGAGLPFVEEEARRKALGGFEVDIATRQYQAALDRATADAKILGDAKNDPAEIKVADGKGGFVTVQGTREQKVRAANGLAVPELGITGLSAPAARGATTPPPAGSLARTPFLNPGQIKEQEAGAGKAIDLADSYRQAADMAASTKTTLQSISSNIGNVVTGPLAPHAQTVASYLRLIDPSFNKQVSSWEDMNSAANELVRKAVRQSDPNPSFIQTRMAFDAMPTPERSPEGIQKLTNRMIGVQDHDVARASAIDTYKATVGNGSVQGFDSWWRNNASPYAFVFMRLSPDDKQAIAARLSATDQGKREIAKLQSQIGFINKMGLEQ